MWELIWSGLGSAVGGFLGVIVFFICRLLFEKKQATPLLIREYLCANDQNDGSQDEEEGELMRHHGRRLSEKKDYEALGASHPIWEWNRDEKGRGPVPQEYASVIYGPYSTDFSEPGTYQATFKIRAVGLPRPADLRKDRILLTLDVNQTIKQYVPLPDGARDDRVQRRIAVHYVRAKKLAEEGWQSITIPFYSDGSGVWEYRIIAKDGKGDKPDNILELGPNVRLFFDSVKIEQVRKFQLPWH